MFKNVDSDFDYKSVVIQGYDKCAEAYQDARRVEYEPSLDFIFENVPENGSILDVGCGAGIPVCKLLSSKYKVSGIDISGKQIELARKNVPSGRFENIDVLDFEAQDRSYDTVVSYYALFHIPKEKHQHVLAKFYRWLKPGGYLVITLAQHEESAYTEDDFFDSTMYWSNLGMNEYSDILSRLGFKILEQTELGPGYVDAEDKSENHPLVIAMKE
jgi:cyclopropane fatty-acyl-phospholipid synthase-like methyltransferase